MSSDVSSIIQLSRRCGVGFCIISLCMSAACANGLQRNDPAEAIAYLDQLLDQYPLPEHANRMKEVLQENLDNGDYGSLSNREELAKALTADLRSIKHDFHLGVQYSPNAPTDDAAHNLDDPNVRERLRKTNYGFQELRILEGNVGFLKITALDAPEVARNTALHALGFLQNTDALIIDLRGNMGGEPEMVQLILSAFFTENTHLNTIHYTDGRENDVIEIWSDSSLVNGVTFDGKSIYVITNFYVASGAEDFAYSLQAQERATIVGRKTLGAAHPGTSHYRADLQLNFNMPHGFVVNPITKTDWEGVGILPDVETTDEQAVDEALSLAWEAIGYKPTESKPLE